MLFFCVLGVPSVLCVLCVPAVFGVIVMTGVPRSFVHRRPKKVDQNICRPLSPSISLFAVILVIRRKMGAVKRNGAGRAKIEG